jgi:hypothetical protein
MKKYRSLKTKDNLASFRHFFYICAVFTPRPQAKSGAAMTAICSVA